MIAVPETPVIKKLAAEKQITFTSDSDLLNNKDIKKIVLDNLADIAKTNKLSGLEKIKAIYLTSDPFSIENDILTPTMKIKRNIAAKVYTEQIDAMYKSLTETAAWKINWLYIYLNIWCLLLLLIIIPLILIWNTSTLTSLPS